MYFKKLFYRHLKFTLKNPGADWSTFKKNFISDFDQECSKKLHSIFDRKKDNETMKDYVTNKIKIWTKLFPSLTSSELNLIELAGLTEGSIKALKAHKSSEKETFIELCDFYLTLNTENDA